VGKPAFVKLHATGVIPRDVGPGEAVVYVAIDGVFAGSIVLRDQTRVEAAATLRDLARLGVKRTVMVTGDVHDTADHIASELGLTEVHAECLPEDKVRIVGQLTPHTVMMVGDGVNDAPVLAASDVGVAMGARGSTAAGESADVVVLLDDLSKAGLAVDIGQRTIKIALESIWLGIIISVGLMVLAAFGFLPAVVGALLQEVVDLIAIVGALRALRG
jgi:P-type E1-E2 ATPase